MMKPIQFFLALCLLHTSLALADAGCSKYVRHEGFFLDLGASYNSIKFDQNYSATGTGDVFDDTNTLVATGEAGGPGAPFSETVDTLAPVIELGYSSRCGCANNFWGVKGSYQYLDIVSNNRLTDTPQAGILDPVGGSMLTFTGNVITKSDQSRVNHYFNFLAFTGLSFREFDFYLGMGPSLYNIKTNVYQAFGFANLSGLPREATGEPVSFSNSKWVWGGAIQLGLSHAINSCWFFDVNYTYSISANCRNHFSAPYTTNLVGGYTNTGTLFINTKSKIRAQSLSLTINRTF